MNLLSECCSALVPIWKINCIIHFSFDRQVSKAEGRTLANFHDAAFFETTAAEEYELVDRVFHEMVREILREQERFMPMRPLYIEEKSSMFSSYQGNGK